MISNVYHYYLKNYANKPPSRFDTHKKSDLRKVYNSIINLNKSAPLYKVDLSQDTTVLQLLLVYISSNVFCYKAYEHFLF